MVNNSLKGQLCENSIVIRQVSSQMDAMNRENIALKNNVAMFQKNEDDLRAENDRLKDGILEAEKRKLEVVNQNQAYQNENQNLLAEIKRLKSLVNNRFLDRYNS